MFWHGKDSTETSQLGEPCLCSAHLLTCTAAPQEDNQEELQRVLGVEFAKDDEEEEEHAGAVAAPEVV